MLANVLCAAVLVLAFLAFEVGVFRLACRVCGVPRPGPLKSVGLAVVLLAAGTAADLAQTAVVVEAYARAGLPVWEAGVVDFALAFPAHMALCSAIHARAMRLPLGDCLGVWAVEKAIKAGLLLMAAAVVVGVLAVAK